MNEMRDESTRLRESLTPANSHGGGGGYVHRNDWLVIGAPRIENAQGRARLTSIIRVRGEDRPVWFEVDAKYGQYLCSERADAFLIGVLNYAMRERLDIRCESPVGSQLLYQIRTYLIPSLVKNSTALYATTIEAELDSSPVVNAGGVGAGISCGVDSLHVIRNYAKSPYPSLSLTHLVLNNVGSFWKKGNDPQYEWHIEHAKSFCREYGFELIVNNSNIREQIPGVFGLTHTYASCFAVYCLQKLWNVFYYGSAGVDFGSWFSLADNERRDCAHYELLSLDVFSTRNLKIYSEGGAMSRFDKMKEIVEYEPSYKYLHVCTSDEGPNCGRCDKCLRTLTTLDALGVLDRYRASFDIDEYRRHRMARLKWLYLQQVLPDGDMMTAPAWRILSDQVSVLARITARIQHALRPSVLRLKILAIRSLPGIYRLYRAWRSPESSHAV